MAKLYNLARMTTATTGTGTITLGSAVAGFLSFAGAGILDGETITYAIKDGSNSEIGRGVFTSSGTTLTRNVLRSTNSNNPIYLSGSAQIFISAAAEDTYVRHGECRLTKSGSNLLLSPLDGNRILINGNVQEIPSAGVSLAATGLTPGTNYYIYAFMNSGTMTLEASTTARATDSSTATGNLGIEIKSGDATRTLVGLARVVTGPAWADSTTQRFVISWFNRREMHGVNAITSNFSTTSTTFVEAMASNRVEFLSWGGVVTKASVVTYNFNSTTAYCLTKTSFDGSNDSFPLASYGTNGYPCTVPHEAVLSEGYHYATALVRVDSGTGTWQGNASFSQTNVHAITMG